MTTTTITPKQAEKKAAEANEAIREREEFLHEVDQRIYEMVRREVRSGKAEHWHVDGDTRTRLPSSVELKERKAEVVSEIFDLRNELAAYQEILADHQPEMAARRIAQLRKEDSENTERERKSLEAYADRFHELYRAYLGWQHDQSVRAGFVRANERDLGGPSSHLESPPKTFLEMFDRFHCAALRRESVADMRYHGGAEKFIGDLGNERVDVDLTGSFGNNKPAWAPMSSVH